MWKLVVIVFATQGGHFGLAGVGLEKRRRPVLRNQLLWGLERGESVHVNAYTQEQCL